jgi:hypothetical protein
MLKVKKIKNTITIQNKSSHMLQSQKPSSFRFLINFNDVPFFFKHGGLIKHKMNLKYKKTLLQYPLIYLLETRT